MESPNKRQDDIANSVNLKEDIKRIALENVTSDLEGRSSIIRFLHRWWCRYYKRPYKDPLLTEYEIEDLLLEFYEVTFYEDEKARTQAQKGIKSGSDKTTEEEEEELLKEMMGDTYQTKDEMESALKGGGGTKNG